MGVNGIGGLLFRAEDPDALNQWYRVHLNDPVGNPIELWQPPA